MQMTAMMKEKTPKPIAIPMKPKRAGGVDLSNVNPFFPIAFPSSLYSTNHQGFVVVLAGVVVVVVIVVVVVEVVVVVVVVVVVMGKNSSLQRYG